MKKRASLKLSLYRETLTTLTSRNLVPVAGGAQAAIDDAVRPITGDTCLCAPTFWETCETVVA